MPLFTTPASDGSQGVPRRSRRLGCVREETSPSVRSICLLIIGSAFHVAVATGLMAQVQIAPVSWRTDGGLRLEQDAAGFAMPASLAFVPNPGPAPDDPLYFVAELRGTIKVVTNDRSVHVFADRVTSYRPREEFPHGRDAEAGLAGLCLAPDEGYVFATYSYRDQSGVFRNAIARFSSTPGRFSVRARDRFDLPLLEHFEGGLSHMIGNCRVIAGHLYVGVGDGWQPHRAGDASVPNGKLLRVSLDGRPPPDNPFHVAASDSGMRGSVFATGLRNPFGIVGLGNRVFVADNGTRIDRLLAIRPGVDYLWRGDDAAIAADAEYVFTYAVGPAQMDYLASGRGEYPEDVRASFIIAASANRENRNAKTGLLAVPWSESAMRVRALPRWLVQTESFSDQIVAAVAVGPDGIYFAPLLADSPDGSPILKLMPDTTGLGRTILTATPHQLLVQRGCVGCHTLNDDYGFGTNIGPPLDADGGLAGRLRGYLHSEAYVRSLDTLERLEGVHRDWAGARREVLAASGDDRVRRWLKYRIMEPRFDRVESRMPNLGISAQEAELMASFLAAPASERGVGAGVRVLARRLLGDSGSRRRQATLLAGGGLLGFAVGVASMAMYRRRR